MKLPNFTGMPILSPTFRNVEVTRGRQDSGQSGQGWQCNIRLGWTKRAK